MTQTCSLCASNRFCGAQGRTPTGIPLRCTRDPGHPGEHAACGEGDDEHPIFRWSLRRPARRKKTR